jgi:DNA-binding FrmR family transcriptional regulator
MSRAAFGRLAGLALVLYGILGLFVALAVVVVGYSMFARVQDLARQLDSQRIAVASSLQTAAGTVHDTAAGMGSFQQTVGGAQQAADQASQLAFNTGISFRQMADQLNVQVFGIQPFATVVPQFQQSADQLTQLAITLGDTRDGLKQSDANVQQVTTDLSQLEGQLRGMSNALNNATAYGAVGQQLLPFEVAFYSMCLLVAMQSIFSIVAGFALMRFMQPVPRQRVSMVEPTSPPSEPVRRTA